MSRGDRREDIFLDWRGTGALGLERSLLGLPAQAAQFAMAVRLGREATLPIQWIAAGLPKGTWKSTKSKLHYWMQVHDKTAITKAKAMVGLFFCSGVVERVWGGHSAAIARVRRRLVGDRIVKRSTTVLDLRQPHHTVVRGKAGTSESYRSSLTLRLRNSIR